MSTFSDWLFETAKAQAEAYRLLANPEPTDLPVSMETDTPLSGENRDTKERGVTRHRSTSEEVTQSEISGNPAARQRVSPAQTSWGGGGENTKSVREAPLPSQFPTIQAQLDY